MIETVKGYTRTEEKVPYVKFVKQNLYVVAHAVLEGTPEEVWEARKAQTYTSQNPHFTEAVARRYVKLNCKHCHGRAVQHFSKGNIQWAEGCMCVQRRLEKLTDTERLMILGLKDSSK